MYTFICIIQNIVYFIRNASFGCSGISEFSFWCHIFIKELIITDLQYYFHKNIRIKWMNHTILYNILYECQYDLNENAV